MHDMGDISLHFWLTRSVARVMGVNLSEAVASQRISPADYANLVTTCRSCPHVGTCQAWLSAQTAITHSAPPHCKNASALQSLCRLH